MLLRSQERFNGETGIDLAKGIQAINGNMPARNKISEDLKKEILKKHHEGATLEALSEEYQIPLVLLQEWVREEDTLDYFIRITSTQEEISNKSWYHFLLAIATILFTKIKANILACSLGLGAIGACFAGLFFYTTIRGNISVDSQFEIAPKLDSLIVSNNQIEGTLEKQYTLTNDLRDSINIQIQNTRNTTINIQNSKLRGTRKWSTKTTLHNTKANCFCRCCQCCINTKRDTIIYYDTIACKQCSTTSPAHSDL